MVAICGLHGDLCVSQRWKDTRLRIKMGAPSFDLGSNLGYPSIRDQHGDENFIPRL